MTASRPGVLATINIIVLLTKDKTDSFQTENGDIWYQLLQEGRKRGAHNKLDLDLKGELGTGTL